MSNKMEWIRRDDLPKACWEWRMDRVIEGVRYRVADLVDDDRRDVAMEQLAEQWAVAVLDGITDPEVPRRAGGAWLRAYRVEG